MTKTIDTYTVIRDNYNAKVPEQFQIQAEADLPKKGEITVMQNDPMTVVVDLNDAAVTAIKVICNKVGDQAFDTVFVGFESSLGISSHRFFDAYQEILKTNQNKTVGEANGFRVTYEQNNDSLVATFLRIH